MHLGNEIGQIFRVDDTTRIASLGKFVQICVEFDLTKPLKARYNLRDKFGKFQYESLHDLCFTCRKYSHKASKWSFKLPYLACANKLKCHVYKVQNQTGDGSVRGEEENLKEEMGETCFGPWMIA